MASTAARAIALVPGSALDAEEVERFSAASFDPAFREAWTASQLRQVLDATGGWLILARGEDDRLLGFALSRMVGDEAELLLCASASGLRRQGIARRLVEAALVSARARGAGRMFLEVRDSNLPARALYDSCGFSQVGVRPGYYVRVTGERVAALTMAKTLF